MRTHNPESDAIYEMNRLDSIEEETELKCCYCCLEMFDNCEYFEGHNYCPQCLNEIKNENQ